MITNTKGFTGHAMGAGIEDVVAIKALETGIVPPVPNNREPDPDLGRLNLSNGASYPVVVPYGWRPGSARRSRWRCCGTPVPDGRHRRPTSSVHVPHRRPAGVAVLARQAERSRGLAGSRSTTVGSASSTSVRPGPQRHP